LVPEQFGFRKGISTEDVTYKLTDNVLKSTNQKMHVGGIFCYLAKAFDRVSHEILLHFYGIQGITVEWFTSYLAYRKQKFKISSSSNTQNLFSNWRTIKHGVPQGSILGPLLFIIHINDLLPTTNTLANPTIFADDTSVIISRKMFDDFCRISNTLLCRMCKWFAANRLALNLDKTNIIKFRANNCPQHVLNVGYNGKCIDQSVNMKFLDLQIDNHLHWTNHIDKLIINSNYSVSTTNETMT
jgi:hypothetical protein